MKNPLHYQISEYDCGPTSLLNALMFLFKREEIPPELIRNIMLYSLDCYGGEGMMGKNGTSRMAMMFLSNWLDGFGKTGLLPISSAYLRGKNVFVGHDSLINDALRRGGVAVVRLYYEVEHYVLFTSEAGEKILLFDPYYNETIDDESVIVTLDNPRSHNRIVDFAAFERDTEKIYALGDFAKREAVLMFNETTKLTAEDTIEYFI